MAESSERKTPSGADDHALVQRLLRGERVELPLLAARLRCVPRALELLNARAGRPLGPEELADLAQDVLVVAWRKLVQYEGLAPLEGWAWGICVLGYRNAVRRRRRMRQEASALASLGGALGDSTRDADPWAFEDVHEGLQRIGREEARVIRLKHFDGLTFEEIARALDISPSTAKARYYRGLEELRPLLGSGGGQR